MRELKDHNVKLEELELKVQLLPDDAEKTADLQRTFPAKVVELASTKSLLEAKKATPKAMVRECDQLNYDFGLAQAVFGREESVIRDFSEWLCTGYTSSSYAHAGDYQDGLNGLLRAAQQRGEYLGGYVGRVGW